MWKRYCWLLKRVCVCDDSGSGCEGMWADAFDPAGELVGATRVRVMFGGGGGGSMSREAAAEWGVWTTARPSLPPSTRAPRWQLSGRHGNECHLFDAALLFIHLARLSSGRAWSYRMNHPADDLIITLSGQYNKSRLFLVRSVYSAGVKERGSVIQAHYPTDFSFCALSD